MIDPIAWITDMFVGVAVVTCGVYVLCRVLRMFVEVVK